MKRLTNAPITSEQAVSVVVGALLMVSILMIAAVQYQNNVIPAQEQQTEFEHNREVRSQLHHLRSNIIATSSSGQIRTTPVSVGTTFEQQFIFGFLPAVQSPNPAGTLETYNVTAERNQNVTITGAEGRGGANNYWQATNQYNYSTSFLNYTIDYARYQDPPQTYYENTVLYEITGETDNHAIQSQQTLVQGKNINLIMLSGDVGTTTTSDVNVQTQPVSAPAQTIVVRSPNSSDGGPLTITIPTDIPAEEWCSVDLPNAGSPNASTACNGGDGAGILDDQLTSTGGGHITNLNMTADGLEMKFEEDETFTLKLSRVHLQTQQDQTVTPQTDPTYVAWLGSEQITFRENTRHTITAQVRDRYNNPVSGVDTVATAFESDDENDCVGDFVSGTQGGVPGCPDEAQPGYRTSGENGEITYFYDTPQVNDDTQVNLNVELANNSEYARLNPPQVALAGADTYSAVDLGNQDQSTTQKSQNESSTNALGSGEILYSHSEESQINNNKTLRVLDATINQSHVVTGKAVRVRVIVDNTGVNPRTAYLQLSSNKSSTTTVNPSTFGINLEPGGQIRYEYKVSFHETGNYSLSLSGTTIDKEVRVHNKSSSVYEGSIQSAVDEQSISKVVTSYKDEINSSDHPAYNPSIPPVVQSSNGTFVNDAEGIVYDFGDAQASGNGAHLTLEGNDTSNELKVGLAFENVPEQDHYTIQLNYLIPEGSENVQMRVVRRDGTTVDPNTKYLLSADTTQFKTKYFTLSNEESEYIRNHKNIYLVFSSDGAPTVDINYMRGISSDNILDTTSGSTQHEDFRVENMNGQPASEFYIYEPIYIDVVKKNTGDSVIEETVQIEENGNIVGSKTVRFNPGETKTITFIKYRQEGVYTYSSRDYDATTVIVGNPSGNTNKAPVPQITSTSTTIRNAYVPSGESVGDDRSTAFELSASESYDPNGDALSYFWKIDGTHVATGETLTGAYFTSDGTYEVTLIVEDEHGNRSAVRTTVKINDIKPTALFEVSPSSVPTGSQAEFNASAALDQDGEIERYIWEVDGTEVANKTDNPYALHEFTSTGTYDVTLTTIDDDGNQNSRTQSVSVFNADVVADFDHAPTQPRVGQEVTLNASNSQADNSTIESYEWTLSDGTVIGTGMEITKAFNTQGFVDVTLTVTTNDGKTATATRTLDVQPPFTADANADPTSGIPGETIYFDAYGSNDPQGMIENYTWDFGDGTTATGQEAFYEYSQPGTYEVQLTVEGNGYTSTDNVTVYIEEDQPVAIAQSNTTIFLTEAVSVFGEDSYHPSATLQYYNWNMGDGTSKSQENVIDYEYANPTLNTGGSRLRQPYNATLTVTDEYGNSDTDYVKIEVENRGPIANWSANETPNGGIYEVYKNETISFDGSHSYHQESPKGSVQGYTWTVNGNTESTSATFTRKWTTTGTHEIALTVDDQYSATDTNSTSVIVYSGPSARLTANPSTVNTGQATELNASQSTPGGPNGATIDEYRWDFDGDGTVEQTTTSATVNHAYSNSGQYNATVTVVNSDGKTDTDNTTITVEATASNNRIYQINNPTDKSTTNYQVNITVQKAANMSADYSSIRFYQNGNSLDYHRVNYNSTSALFVVELNKITSAGATVNMTYGGSRTTASNPEATYLAYDYHGNGMDDGTFYGSAYDVNNNYARLTEDLDGQQGSLRYGSNDVGLKAHYEWRIAPSTGYSADSLNFVTFNNGNRYEHEDPNGNGIHFAINDHDDCVAVNYNGQCHYTTGYNKDTNWHKATAEISEAGVNTGNYNYYFDSGASGAGTLSGTLSASGLGNQFGFSGRTGGANNRHEVRSITIRKYLGQPMKVTPVKSEIIDGFERGNMNPYIVSDSSFIYTTDRASTQGGTSLAMEVPCCGEQAYSNSGLSHYPTRGDYITARINFLEGQFSWGEYYGTRMSIGFGGTGSTPAYTVYIKGNNGQRLQLQANGHGTVDSTYVNWANYEGQWLRLHIDYDAHGDGMIRAHMLDENNNRIATVSWHDPNGPNGGSQLYFGLVGDTNREGTVYIDEIKRTPNQAYTDDWASAGLTNWNQASGSWSNPGERVREDSGFNGNTLVNPNFKMNVSEGVYMEFDSYLGGEFANYNRVYLRNSGGSTTNWMGLAHDDYNGRDGVVSGFAGGDGWRLTGQSVYGYQWEQMNYQYNPSGGGECQFEGPGVWAWTSNCQQPSDPIVQEVRLGGWSHYSGDQWRNLYIKRNYSDKLVGGTIYNHDFQSSYDGWTTETGQRTLKNGDNGGGWMTAGCSYYDQTNTFTKNLGSHNANQVSYEIRLAAIDSWDGETLRFQIKDDTGWNTVKSTTPEHYAGSTTSLDCVTGNGWYTSIYTWSGTFNPTGDIQAVRVDGGINQDDADESIGIDYVNITRTD